VGGLPGPATAMTTSREMPGALGRYQDLRLASAAGHVAASERATAAYLAHAAHNPRTGG
jgi:hypothetical protein